MQNDVGAIRLQLARLVCPHSLVQDEGLGGVVVVVQGVDVGVGVHVAVEAAGGKGGLSTRSPAHPELGTVLVVARGCRLGAHLDRQQLQGRVKRAHDGLGGVRGRAVDGQHRAADVVVVVGVLQVPRPVAGRVDEGHRLVVVVDEHVRVVVLDALQAQLHERRGGCVVVGCAARDRDVHLVEAGVVGVLVQLVVELLEGVPPGVVLVPLDPEGRDVGAQVLDGRHDVGVEKVHVAVVVEVGLAFVVDVLEGLLLDGRGVEGADQLLLIVAFVRVNDALLPHEHLLPPAVLEPAPTRGLCVSGDLACHGAHVARLGYGGVVVVVLGDARAPLFALLEGCAACCRAMGVVSGLLAFRDATVAGSHRHHRGADNVVDGCGSEEHACDHKCHNCSCDWQSPWYLMIEMRHASDFFLM